MIDRISRGLLGWVVGWLVLAAVVSILLGGVRTRVLAQLDRPEVRADWQRWKSEAQRQAAQGKGGPVQRRPPRSDEHPALVLMRDYFSVVLASALVLGSCLYAFLAIALRGAWQSRGRGTSVVRRRLPDLPSTPP